MRILAASAKKAGHEVRMIFLSRASEGGRVTEFGELFDREVLASLAELTTDCGVIGLSVMTNYFTSAAQVTDFLKKTTAAPIMWGGIHATVRPEECLMHADYVCVGEGEEAFIEFVQRAELGQRLDDIQNIWSLQDGQVRRNLLGPLIQDLDQVPYPDYDLDDDWVLHGNRLVKMDEDLLMEYLAYPPNEFSKPTYMTMMSRGCTFRCTYCSSSVYHNTYAEHGCGVGTRWRLRRRSVPNFVEELVRICARYPQIGRIEIDDDAFIAKSSDVEVFCEQYTKALSVPLFVTGFQPAMVLEPNIDLLIKAGMERVRMGVQTGSPNTMSEVYHRPAKREQVIAAAQVLHKFRHRMDPPMYDIIVDNPWETDKDQLQTLDLLLQLPKPYHLNLFSLTLFPGTALYDRAKAEGILTDDHAQVYEKSIIAPRRTYMNGLFYLAKYGAPRWLIRSLASKPLLRIKSLRLVYLFVALGRGGELARAATTAVRHGNWGVLKIKLRRAVRQVIRRS
jgi:radical SAM superfamily enzyme YgiQ (UPF0313 family)